MKLTWFNVTLADGSVHRVLSSNAETAVKVFTWELPLTLGMGATATEAEVPRAKTVTPGTFKIGDKMVRS